MTDPQSTPTFPGLPDLAASLDSLAGGEGALAQIRLSTQRLLSLVEENQRRVVAASAEIRPGQKGEPLLWNELFQEAFHLQAFQKHLEIIQASTAQVAQSLQARVHLADPEQPLTEVALGRPVSLNLGLSLEKLERFWILSTLHALRGNRSQCAARLGIALRTVRNKLDSYRREGFKVPAPGGGRLLERSRTSLGTSISTSLGTSIGASRPLVSPC